MRNARSTAAAAVGNRPALASAWAVSRSATIAGLAGGGGGGVTGVSTGATVSDPADTVEAGVLVVSVVTGVLTGATSGPRISVHAARVAREISRARGRKKALSDMGAISEKEVTEQAAMLHPWAGSRNTNCTTRHGIQ